LANLSLVVRSRVEAAAEHLAENSGFAAFA
jgi:hypothetical protein